MEEKNMESPGKNHRELLKIALIAIFLEETCFLITLSCGARSGYAQEGMLYAWVGGLLFAAMNSILPAVLMPFTAAALLRSWRWHRFFYGLHKLLMFLGSIFTGFFVVVFRDSLQQNLHAGRADFSDFHMWIFAFLCHLISWIGIVVLSNLIESQEDSL